MFYSNELEMMKKFLNLEHLKQEIVRKIVAINFKTSSYPFKKNNDGTLKPLKVKLVGT